VLSVMPSVATLHPGIAQWVMVPVRISFGPETTITTRIPSLLFGSPDRPRLPYVPVGRSGCTSV